MRSYKEFPKGDARRYFTVLVAIVDLGGDATLHYISQRVGCTRAEAQRAIETAAEQFGMDIEKAGPVYRITGWGALDKREVRKLLEV
ncbi:hypothetical protein [Paraburkholderia largidicola]|uniref:Uncharacterized protein n=1 Tax=Paraburkholderia largidicola TaxID=3014751 RepID=A0A7I8C2U8_9BURK|nr:hypothetical protein [Paraburkholderia sp. PGU16]BCF95364.1 hypothetical protein PPGU16_84310 [Paraburkholderia sp. PGU16]